PGTSGAKSVRVPPGSSGMAPLPQDLFHAAVRANRVRRHSPFLHGGIGELLPSALRPAHRTPEGRETVLVALAGLRPALQQDGDDLRTAEERGPPEGNGVVLPIQKRDVCAALQKHSRSV